MSSDSFRSASNLPPRPDPVRGEPWPPRAPGPNKRERIGPSPGRSFTYQGAVSLATVSPPAGEGPALAWYQHILWHEAKEAIAYSAIYGAFLTTLLLTEESRYKWWLLLALFIVPVVVFFRSNGSSCSAGAEWLRRERGGWVRTYELDIVEVIGMGNGLIYLEDTSGRDVSLDSRDAFANQKLWDLVYNGILHSVIIGGAKTNKAARELLDLPSPT